MEPRLKLCFAQLALCTLFDWCWLFVYVVFGYFLCCDYV